MQHERAAPPNRWLAATVGFGLTLMIPRAQAAFPAEPSPEFIECVFDFAIGSGTCSFHCDAGWTVFAKADFISGTITASCGGVTVSCSATAGPCGSNNGPTQFQGPGSCTTSSLAIVLRGACGDL